MSEVCTPEQVAALLAAERSRAAARAGRVIDELRNEVAHWRGEAQHERELAHGWRTRAEVAERTLADRVRHMRRLGEISAQDPALDATVILAAVPGGDRHA